MSRSGRKDDPTMRHGSPAERPRTRSDALIDEAAHLLLRVRSSSADAAAAREAAEWQARSSDHARAWSAAERFWSATGQIGADHPVFNSARAPVRRNAGRRRQPSRRIAAAVGAAVAACLAIAVWPSISLALRSDYRTGTGELQTVALADGSSVSLDTGSAITVDRGSGRGVTLLAGRAWFEVAKDRRRPFRVTAGNVVVTVTGTRFDVGMEGEGVDVRLAEGSVRADFPGATGTNSRELRPGDYLRYEGPDAIARVSPVPVQAIAAWRRGKLLIEGAPLEDIVDQLRPYYAGKIIITSDAMGREKVTGAFDVRNPAEALRSMVSPHGGVVRQFSPWILVVSAS